MTFWKITMLLSLSAFLILACGPEENGIPGKGETAVANPTAVSNGLPSKAVLNARDWLAARLNVPHTQVQINDMEQAEWTDSCLGLGQLNESCATVVTPGWKVTLQVYGQSYEVRTDETGTSIRLASPEETPSANIQLENSHWKLVSFGPPETNTPLLEKSLITLMFIDGKVAGMGGCNSYGGTYQTDGENISFDEITITKRACKNELLTVQQDYYLMALESAGRYEVDGNMLRIWYEDGAGLLVFQTPSPAELTPMIETPDS